MNQIVRTPPPAVRGFDHIETWVFDLDNTLYPHDASLWEQVDARITIWIAGFFGLDGLSARALQKHYYRQHGTSLRGLMTEERLVPDEFLEFCHDIDHSLLAPSPELSDVLSRLPGRRLIFTSGSVKHAANVCRRLGCFDQFEGVFDIVAAEYLPKPARATYELFLKVHGVDPARAAMFEDLSRNLAVPHDLGMTTVLVVPRETREIFRDDWELEGRGEPHVDHVTDDLTGFLTGIAGRR